MILMYHKIDIKSPTQYWVTVKDFERQMAELADKEVVSLYNYDSDNPNQVVITFDGVYENVYKYAFPILKKYGYPFHLFVTSDFIGKDNSFDITEPLTKFASMQQIQQMVAGGGMLEWHTQTHRSFSSDMSEEDLVHELTIPDNVRILQPNGFKWFAYPYGFLSEDKLHFISDRFQGAVAVWQGNKHNKYKLNRLEVHSEHSFAADDIFYKKNLDNGLVSVIVPTYNVAPYLHDFFQSILFQSYKNLEIIIVTDAPTDNSVEIAEYYAEKDKRIKIMKNKENLGVARTLCRGYAAATGDFCATMSPDDTIDMYYFENLMKKQKETNSDVVCARMLATQKNYMFTDNQDFTVIPFAGKIGLLFYFYPALVKRKMIVENNIWDDSVVERHWEDILIRCKYAYYANHVSVATKAIRYYTIRETSLSHKPTEIQLEYMVRAEQRSGDFLHSVGIDDVRIKIVGGFQVVGGWDIRSWFVPDQGSKSTKKTRKKKRLRKLLFRGLSLLLPIKSWRRSLRKKE